MYMYIAIMLLFSSILFNLLSWLFLMNKLTLLIEWNFFFFLSMNFKFIILIDWMTNLFIMTIFLISSSVIFYSIEYMNNDININRFMLLIMIFITSMIFMIICPNMMSILIGWDGLGISSYCLIIFYQNFKSINSSLMTMLMNRIGDIMIIMMMTLMINFKNFNFMFLNNLNLIMSLMMFICAITKSAQIPFSIWLPMAMAAPTPVSSLVHSSTLVTAGIFLMIRFINILNSIIIMMMMYMSLFTMIMSSLNAIFEFDLKKIIALSTLSQLSLMMFILSFNLAKLSFFHLISHAMFKSLMFLCSGIMIHNYFNNQDIRLMNMFSINMKFTTMIFNMASLSLCGLPFLSGFYSKDLIIEMFNMLNNNFIIFIMLYASLFLTIMYSMRLIYYTSIINNKLTILNNNNLNSLMIKSIIILLMMTIMFSSMMNWILFFNMNIIFLTNLNKLMIYLNFIILYPIMSVYNKMKFMYNKKYFFMMMNNSSMFLNLMFKNLNNYLPKMNLIYLMNINYGWLENFNLISYNMMMYKLLNNMKLKKMNMFNMILLSIMLLYLMN